MKFLGDQKFLYLKQFRFPKNISTSHAIISVIKNIQKSVYDNKLHAEVL